MKSSEAVLDGKGLEEMLCGLDQNCSAKGSYIQASFAGVPLAVNLDSLADIAVCSRTLAEQLGFKIYSLAEPKRVRGFDKSVCFAKFMAFPCLVIGGCKFRVSVYLFDVGMKLLLGNQFLYFPNNRVKMDYENGLVEIKGRKIKMFSTYEEARFQGDSGVSEVKCEVLEVSSEDRNLVVLHAGQDLFLKPHSITFI